MSESIEEVVAREIEQPADIPLESQVVALKGELHDLERRNKKLMEQIGEGELFVDRITSAIVAAKPYQTYTYQSPKKGTEAAAILKLSDWHIGEVVSKIETEGFGGYDFDIAKRRMLTIADDFVKWSRVQRHSYKMEEAHLFCEGDFIAGDIHRELSVTNEFPLPVQTEKAGNLLGEVMRIIHSHFKRVVVWQNAADNHGRLVKKPQSKQCALNNMSRLVYAVANARTSRCNRLQIQPIAGIKKVANVLGTRWLIQHGNGIKCHMGIPYYGISRGVGRESKKRLRMNKEGFDYISMAHFHVPAVIEDIVFVNGALSGTTEYDHGQGRYCDPAQCAVLVSKKRQCYFNWTPFRVK